MSESVSRSPLWTTLRRIRGGRLSLALALVGGVAQHGGAVVAAAAGGWLAGSAASGVDVDGLRPGIVVLVVAVVVCAVGAWAASQFGHAFAFRYQADIRLSLYDGLERGAPRELHGRRTGDVAAVAMGDVDQMELLFAHLAPGVVNAVTVSVATVVALAIIDPRLALITAVGMAVLAVLPIALARRSARTGDRLRAELGDLNADVVDGIQGLRELVLFGQVRMWRQRLLSRTDRIQHHQMTHGRATGWQYATTDFVVGATTVAVLLAAVSPAASGRLGTAAAVTAVALVVAALRPVVEVTELASHLAPLRASARRILEITDQPALVADTARELPAARGSGIEFDRVRFGYEPGRTVLSDLSFTVARGSTVALVGASGAGKSTCVNLLLRFWDTDAGTIRVDGVDLRDYPLAALREAIAVIPQDVYLFDGTVAENLSIGRPDATRAEIEAAARAANAHEFITAMPGGYDASTGERGARLSGGQRQRLAIARALLVDAPILVMDEAAANLDTENERDIQAALRTARAGRTTVIIAHRLSTIRSADHILVLDNGRIVERGTHEQLHVRGGVYAALVAARRDGVIGAPEPADTIAI